MLIPESYDIKTYPWSFSSYINLTLFLEFMEADQAVPGLKKEANSQLDELEAKVDDAFQGPAQRAKQNRAAKSFLGESQELQREVNKNTN